MKYLKKFNESSNDEYYQRIPLDPDIDYFFSFPFTGSLKKVDFENKYFDQIKRRLKNEEFSIHPPIVKGMSMNIIRILNKLKLDTYNYEIGQSEDEWFYIEKSHSRFYKLDNPSKKPVYYKCDQFDGLIKFLEDNNVIN